MSISNLVVNENPMLASTKIHPLVWSLLVGTFLSRTALFITLPFISIYMTTKLGASPTTAGIITGLGPLCGIFSAFLMGYVSDKIGRRQILIGSLLVWSFAFFGFSQSKEIWEFAMFNMIYGISRSSFESVAAALMTDLTDKSLRKKVFHFRYYFINLGACIAPPIGAWLFVQHPQYSFMITGGVYFLYCISLSMLMQKFRIQKIKDVVDPVPINLSKVINVIRKDTALLLFLFGNILMLIGFSQIDTNIPLLLQRLYGNPGIKLFSYVALTNAVTVVLFQFPINNAVKKFNVIHAITIGFIFYGIGMMLFGAFLEINLLLCLAMFIFTIGEILVFSNTSLLIDQIGPSHLKGSYFGITELTTLGLVVGPFIGGLFVERNAGPLMFVFMGALSMVSILAYLRGNQLIRRRAN